MKYLTILLVHQHLNTYYSVFYLHAQIVCNFVLSLLCSVLAAVSSFYSFLIVEQCSDVTSGTS